MSAWVVMGHRGVGKTSLLNTLKPMLRGYQIVSLDQIIEDSTAQSIDQIFAEVGESGFREMESQYFNRFVTQNKDYILDLRS